MLLVQRYDINLSQPNFQKKNWLNPISKPDECAMALLFFPFTVSGNYFHAVKIVNHDMKNNYHGMKMNNHGMKKDISYVSTD